MAEETKKLEELTPEQEAMFPYYVEKWLKVGFATGDCNFEKAKFFVDRSYELAELAPPKHKFVADSPLSCCFMGAMLDRIADKYLEAVGQSEKASGVAIDREDWRDLINTTPETFTGSIVESPDDADELQNKVRLQLLDQLMEFLNADQLKAVDDLITPKVTKEEFQEQINSQIYGNCETWLSFYDFFNNETVVDVPLIEGLIGMSHTSGWWMPKERYAIIQHKPEFICMENEELHNEEGPAIYYRDGFKVWAIAGVQVNEQIIMHPEFQTLEQIDNEENEEIKRIRIERYGWQKFLDQKNAKVLDEWENAIEGTTEGLMLCEGMHVLVAACPSTARVYFLEVPTACTTCEEAQIWLAGGQKLNMVGGS